MFAGKHLQSKSIALVSNISKKTYNYVFETASAHKIHPMRNLSNGTDRLLLTPNLIAIADHTGQNQFSKPTYIEQTYAPKLLLILKSFFYQEPLRYCENILKLVSEAVSKNVEEGSCTLTVAALHPKTGDLSFYYIGDSLYGIFREKNVQLVDGLYESFNKPIKIGYNCEYTADCGYSQTYKKEEISKEDVIVLGSNGLWNNLDINSIHYQVRGPGSLQAEETKYRDGVGGEKREPRSLEDIAERVGTFAGICARRGKYQSPIYLRAKSQNINFPKEGFLDDVSLILARRKKSIVIDRSQDSQSLQQQQNL